MRTVMGEKWWGALQTIVLFILYCIIIQIIVVPCFWLFMPKYQKFVQSKKSIAKPKKTKKPKDLVFPTQKNHCKNPKLPKKTWFFTTMEGSSAASLPTHSIVVKIHGFFGSFGFLQWFFWVGKTRSLGFLVFLGFAMLFGVRHPRRSPMWRRPPIQ